MAECTNRTLMAPAVSAPLAAVAGKHRSGGDPDALLYITVVLFVYALGVVLLMVKYIRREKQEHVYDNYFVEFVKREQFRDSPAAAAAVAVVDKIIVEKKSAGMAGRTYGGTDQQNTKLVPV